MKPVLATNDPVVLSYAQHLLNEANIINFVFDGNISAVEGAIGIFPKRLMVGDDDVDFATETLRDDDVTRPYCAEA